MAFVLPASRAPISPRRSPLSPEPLDERAVDALLPTTGSSRAGTGGLNLIGPGTAGGDPGAPLWRVARRAPPAASGGASRAGPRLGRRLSRPRPRRRPPRAGDDPGRGAGAQVGLPPRRRPPGALPCRCLNVRVQVPLPAGLPESIDVITSRALRLDPETWSALANRLDADGRVLLWVGEDDPELPPDLVACGELRSRGARGGASWRCAAPLPSSERKTR